MYFLDPILGPVSGPPFLGSTFWNPFSVPTMDPKNKKMFCVANIFGSKEAENHIYRADLMVTLKRMDEYNARMFEVLHQNFNAASNASVVDVARKKQNPRLGRPLAVSPVFVAKNDPHFGVLKAHVFQAMK